MKIKSGKLCVEISVNCFIDAKDLLMQNLDDGSTKSYSEIEDEDIGNWIIQDSIQVMGDCDEIDHVDINIISAV